MQKIKGIVRARQNSKSTWSKTLNGLARVGEKYRIGKGLFWDIYVCLV